MANKKKTARKRYTTHDARDSQRRAQTIRRILISVLIIAVILSTVFFLILRRDGTQISIAENGIGSLLTPVQNAFSSATNTVKRFVTNWRNYDTLEDEFYVLSRENEQLALELASAEEALLENERLKDLLEAQDAYESLDPIYARVIARDAGQWFQTFSVNRGDAHGVSVGMAVVNGDGLIGRVYEVGLNYSKVLTIIDSRSGLACLVQRTRDNGIMRGGVADSGDDAVCSVHYLPNVNSIVPGDVVVTSGTDELFPKGLIIGTVTQISLDAGSQGNFAIIQPAVDFLHIEEVLILRDVVETDDTVSSLPSMITPTPSPTSTPSPSPDADAHPTLDPDIAADSFAFPTPGTAPVAGNEAAAHLETLPEDLWADS